MGRRRVILIAGWVALVFASGSLRAAGPQTTPSTSLPRTAADYRVVLDKYCVRCHNGTLKTAGLLLDRMDIEDVSAGAEVWEKVVRKLRAGTMPPPGLPRPAQPASDAFASWLETSLDTAAAAEPNPGRPAVHRLNRAEYTNAIRDLLAVEIDGRLLLPADALAYGFDNNADFLSVSTGLLERYMSAAKKVSRLAVGDPAIRPEFVTYRVSNTRSLVQDDRMSEDLPFGSRGGLAFRHNFPLDAEYVLRIRTLVQGRALPEPQQLDVRVDGKRVALLTVGGESATAYTLEQDPEVVRFAAKAGRRVVGLAFVKNTSAVVGLQPEHVPVRSTASMLEWGMWIVGSVEVGGPYNTAGPGDTLSRQRIFVCRPPSLQDEEPCAKKILATLARRAYRRPARAEDVQTLLGFFKAGRAEGSFDAGIQNALQRLLVDPDFLFRIEHDPGNVAPATAYRVSDLDLASRLSFFLWSSIPDDELLQLAERGRLKDPAEFEHQVRRMLADPRSNALVKNFAGQWLHLRNVWEVRPDVYRFPEFDDNLREAFHQETELFLEHQLREDRSVVELLSANYSFVNERLARHYGIPNVYGSHFRRVAFNDDTRGGLLGQGSILTVTSLAHRTSVVLRGKWILENILGAPPPPPPADVPALTERGEGSRPRSLRELMEQHRKNPVCAACHVRMDPLGFALENFDGIGKWRTTDAGTRIDASGTFSDGTQFDGPVELRKVLMSHRGEFVRTVTEKLLTYALGRGTEYYDAPAIRQIVEDAAPSDYRWSSIILGIVESTPFQMRRSAP